MFSNFSAKNTHIFLKVMFGVLCVLALGFFLFTSSKPVSYHFSHNSSPEVTSTQEQAEQYRGLPIRLVIPRISVDAEVQYVGVTTNGTGEMDVPSNFTDVGWYKESVRPGMHGSAVIAGHYNGKKVPKAVFYDLDKLKIGDEVIVMSSENAEEIFYVVDVATYAYDAPTAEVFESTDATAKLNLITCSGDWLSEEKRFNKRTVVFTEQISQIE